MAVVARIFVEAAGQADHDAVQAVVEARVDELGGPPEGLMVHLGYPDRGGVVLVQAWRDEVSFRTHWEQVIRPALTEAGLAAGEPELSPAWSIARP